MRRSPLRVALQEVRQHPIRTLLVCQGMIWAVAIAIVPASVLDGSRRRAVERAAELGTDRIEVTVEDRGTGSQIELEDLSQVVALVSSKASVAGLRQEPVSLLWGDGKNTQVRKSWVIGASSGVFEARHTPLLAGADFTAPAVGFTRSVAPPVVLERNLARLLLGLGPAEGETDGEDFSTLLGRSLWIQRRQQGGTRVYTQLPDLSDAKTQHGVVTQRSSEYQIVGVVANPQNQTIDRFGNEKGRLFAQQIQEFARAMGVMPPGTPWLESGFALLVPLEQVPGENIDWMFVRAKDASQVPTISSEVEQVLVAGGCTPLLYQNSLLNILSQPELDGYAALHVSLSRVYLGIGLLVLANLLLLSGWRRRREIALRRTEGASRRDIFWQFIFEGFVIALLGWVFGVVAGQLLAWLRVALDPNVLMGVGWPWRAMVEQGAVLMLGAVVASAYPAWKASGHQPMTLFRGAYE